MGFILDGDVINMSIDIDINAITKRNIQKNKDLYKLGELLPAIERGLKLGLDEIKDEMYQRLIVATTNIPDISVELLTVENGFILSASGEQVVYLEFGTGIVGSANPHPRLDFANEVLDGPWEYDINNHGVAGWNYRDKNGQLQHTTGLPSQHFMYDVWLWGRQSYSNKIRKHINRELKRL